MPILSVTVLPMMQEAMALVCTRAVRASRALELLTPLADGGMIVHRRRWWHIVKDGQPVDAIPRDVVRRWAERGVIEGSEQDGWTLTNRGRLAMTTLARSR